MSDDSAPSDSAGVKVVVRVRPFNDREHKKRSTCIISMTGQQTVIQDPSRVGRSHKFTFDHSIWSAGDPSGVKLDSRLPAVGASHADQATVYSLCGNEVIQHAVDGYNVSVFAYGQTGSGKSYSMMGASAAAASVPTTPTAPTPSSPEAEAEAGAGAGHSSGMSTPSATSTGGTAGATSADNPNSGIIPRICTSLYQLIRANEVAASDMESAAADARDSGGVIKLFKVEVSYVEIYMEQVKDLLNPNPKGAKALRVREDPKGGPFVDGLTFLPASSVTDMLRAIEDGNSVRTVASTAMNAVSSRSHAIFTIVFTQTTVDPGQKRATDKISKINLVDLAGSERADSTGAMGKRLKEASMINKSLTTLGRVIATLAKKSAPGAGGRVEVVPYRDSVLTFLLKESLGGNARTTMIAAIAPASVNYEETLSTLRYADQAKKIMNRAVVNEDPTTRLIRELREEIMSLREELASLRTGKRERRDTGGQARLEDQLARASGLASVLSGISDSPPVSPAGPAGSAGPSSPSAADASATPSGVTSPSSVTSGEASPTPVAPGASFVGLRRALAERQTEVKRRNRRASIARQSSLRQGMGGAVPRQRSASGLPCLTNLNEDPLLSECLLYPISVGTTYCGADKAACEALFLSDTAATAGSADGDTPADTSAMLFMEIRGQAVQPVHAKLVHARAGVSVVPVSDDGFVYMNGAPLAKAEPPRALRHNDRLLFGRGTFLRFSDSSSTSLSPPTSAVQYDWQFAYDEVAAARSSAEAAAVVAASDAELARVREEVEADAAKRIALAQSEMSDQAKKAQEEARRAKEALDTERKALQAKFQAAQAAKEAVEAQAVQDKQALAKAEEQRLAAQSKAEQSLQAAREEAEKAEAAASQLQSELARLQSESVAMAKKLEDEKRAAKKREDKARAETEKLKRKMAVERALEDARKAKAEDEARLLAEQHAAQRADEDRRRLAAASEAEREVLRQEAEAAETARKATAAHAQRKLDAVRSAAEAAEAQRRVVEQEREAALAAAKQANEQREEALAALAAAEQARLEVQRDAEVKRVAAEAEAEQAKQASAAVAKELDRLRAKVEAEKAVADELRRSMEKDRQTEADRQAQAQAVARRLADQHGEDRAEEERRRAAAESEAERAALKADAAKAEAARIQSEKAAEAEVARLKAAAAEAEKNRQAMEAQAAQLDAQRAKDVESLEEQRKQLSSALAASEQHRRAQEVEMEELRKTARDADHRARLAEERSASITGGAGQPFLVAPPDPVAAAPPIPPEIITAVPATSSSSVDASAGAGASATPSSASRLDSKASPTLSMAATPLEFITEGFLRKQGVSNTKWKRRWVKLDGEELLYSKAPGGAWVGRVSLRHAAVFRRPDSLPGKDRDPFVFHVAVPAANGQSGRLFFFQANSGVEVETWVRSIGRVANIHEDPDEELMKQTAAKCTIM